MKWPRRRSTLPISSLCEHSKNTVAKAGAESTRLSLWNSSRCSKGTDTSILIRPKHLNLTKWFSSPRKAR